ncbi:1-acyl-sn-glycerol-3-phosphate acyltransferase [Henriciella litoralis]|uniref:1-acyl-sn-glycerol-3-phosphate acyltransferase n=1 Tax=Henriciella litoralis TaxID=568102 RepID=UPI0009FB9968|nr:1-acyl-sn-glycerol-3-phosphate acyltransferase [Henriciella litoralis]
MTATSPLATKRPSPSDRRGPFGWLWRQFCALYLGLGGWKVEGDWPAPHKAVLIAAPHTSNWDGMWMLAAAGFYRIKLRWIGKQALVDHPFGWLIRWLGCVPVDRKAARDMVDQMAVAFAQEDRLILAVAPEGTRSATREWKSGFYRIARRADVPLIISVLDYGARTIRIAGIYETTGDYEADLAGVRAYYSGAKGRYAEKFDMTER